VGVCRSYLDVWGPEARERLVYLTSDSENVLTELSADKVALQIVHHTSILNVLMNKVRHRTARHRSYFSHRRDTRLPGVALSVGLLHR
jgi:hypothetical protein